VTETIPRFVRLLPVGVLLIAIAAQAVLMQTVNADPQGGSGFAMFSSVDFDGSRVINAWALVDDQAFRLELPSDLTTTDDITITPTNRRAQQLADELASLSWDLSDPELAVSGGDQQLDAVTVTIRGLTADGQTLGSKVLAQATSS